GLVCRGILSTLPDHNVHSFISLSAPQAGQYGDTDYLKYLFPQFVKANLYHLCYTAIGQRVSICNYWNDPHHRDLYVNSSDYLALINSERTNPNSTALTGFPVLEEKHPHSMMLPPPCFTVWMMCLL
ncbi:Lysosomal thioesterase PPT2-A, partial [Ilyodon furcidens]